MAETELASLQFLPWVRQGAAAEITDGGGLTVQLKVNADDVTMPLRVLGPAAVTGIDPKQIIRMEPRPGTVDFTPYNFPAIEFDRPDFLWLFTPTAGDGNDRLRPWLCLVVVRKQLGVSVRFSQGASLPILEIKSPAIPRNELPDLEESWAWGHAQVAGKSAALSPEEGLSKPALNLSRLVCPRKLEPNADYVACVVPAFEAGRKAGLGLPDDPADSLKPAWPSGEPALAEIVLPIYHHWEFRAGPPVDFESLVRLLKARPLPDKAGKRDMWIGNAGSGLPQIPPDATGAILALEGALRPLDPHPIEWPDSERSTFQTQLRAVVNAPADALDQGAADPVVAPPIYGRWQAGRTRVELSGGQPPWLHELNLDPRNRAAAGLGAEVIRRDQESLMAAAWEQVGQIEQANELLRRAQVARSVSASLHERHFQKMPESTLVQVTTPAYAMLSAAPMSDGGGPSTLTLLGQISRSTSKAVPVALRKIVRPRAATIRPSVRLRPRATLTSAAPQPSLVTIEAVSEAVFAGNPETRFKVRSLGAAPQLVDVPPRPGFAWVFTIQAEGTELLPGHWERQRAGEPPGHRPTFLNFQAAATAQENRNPRPPFVAFASPLQLGSLKATLLAQLDPAVTIPTRVRSRIKLSAEASNLTPAPEDPLEQIMAAPDFPRPMYEALREISSDYLLPGLEHIPPNTATLLQTNPLFVEAFLAGLSTEMARELLWREFPTDQRGTYFRQFWAAANPAESRQIKSIHEWQNPLGENPEIGLRQVTLVLLIRGELLRRYPDTIIYARRAILSGTRRVPGPLEKYPLFRGSLDPDVTFVGFDLSDTEALGTDTDPGWFFVLQEQPTAPRFGLDKAEGFADTIPQAAKWSDLSWGHLARDQGSFDGLTHVPASAPLPDTSAIQQPPGIIWGKNSAHLAFATYQQPVRISIHASDMIPKKVDESEVVR